MAAVAAFLRLGARPFIDQKELESSQKKRPEPTAFFGNAGKNVPLQQPIEKLLGRVLCFMLAKAAAPDIRVEGIPVTLADLG